MRLRGILTGVLSLVVLETLLSSDAAASRVGSAGNVIASLIRRAISPAVPLIPDLRPAVPISGTWTTVKPTGVTTTKPTTAPAPSHTIFV